jgi:hypothetical protein
MKYFIASYQYYITYDDTGMFDIDNQGKIEFTARITGTYNVTITVEDRHGNYDKKSILFIIS